MELKYIISVLALGLVAGQNVDNETKNVVDQLFTSQPPKTSDFLQGYEEVTKPPGRSIGAIEKCGEGSDQGVHVCVQYYMCDAKTKTIVQNGVTDGFGIIEIRNGENTCNHYLDVCCKIPEGGLNPNVRKPDELVPFIEEPTEPKPEPIPVTPTSSPSYCGIRNPGGIDFKITGNQDNAAGYGEFPWMVAILDKKYDGSSSKRLLLCGGSLITPNVVLTAAHCVNRSKSEDIKIRAGEWDTQTTRERLPYQERDVLSSSITKAEHVGTICLPTQAQKIESRDCYVSGWGKDLFGKEGRYATVLKKVELPVVSRTQCQNALRKTRLGRFFELHTSFMCAGGVAGKDACIGDGGSPLVCPDPLNPNRYVQAGIVAWGIGCGEESVPGVYADVAKFRSWIDGHLKRLNIDSSPYNL